MDIFENYHTNVVIFNAVMPITAAGAICGLCGIDMLLAIMAILYTLEIFISFMERWLGKPKMVYDLATETWIMALSNDNFIVMDLKEFGFEGENIFIFSPFSSLRDSDNAAGTDVGQDGSEG